MTSAPAADATANPGKLETFVYNDGIVRMFLWATVIWALVAFLVGIIIALQLPFPGLSFGLEYLTFGRLRPLHTNAAIFAFAGNAIFAAIYYSTQRLCKARMWSDALGQLHFWGWQAIIVSAAVTLPLGISQSKEYAELEWPIDIAIAVVWAGFFGVNFFMTLVRRRERHMYVALWFYIATIVTVAILHIFNNLVVPAGLLKSYPIYAGVQDAMMQWWYGHNAVAFFLTTPFLGLMYYFLPKAANRPVFSYRLSILHFWSLVFIYIWAGPHHLHYTALPQWAQSLGMLFSLMLWMPSWGGMINGLLTLRGAWHKVTTDPVLKFFVVAVTFYGMATFEGPMLSIKAVNSLSHYTDWTIGHVHAGALGWNGFMAYGLVYWLAPKLFQTKLYSTKLANLHFWVATIGILLYVISMYVAGLTQGLMWRAINESGQLAYPDFVETTTAILPMYYIRILGGVLFFAGAVIGTYNLVRTWMARPKTYETPEHQAPALRDTAFTPEAKPAPQIDGVMDVAKKIDVWASLWWHRVWERMPLKFTVWVIVAVLIASILELVPTFVIRTNLQPGDGVQPYSPLELAGRDIYIAEGCYNCHSQMIRPMVAETKRYGDYSRPQEFVYDHPFQWGSRRIGPDLAREGGKQSNIWHIQHFDNPSEITPGSIMPKYHYLLEKEVDFSSVSVRVGAMQALGVPYPQYENGQREQARVDAEEQAKEILAIITEQNNGQPYPTEYDPKTNAPTDYLKHDAQAIALIAYLQRLGVAVETPAEEEASEPTEPVVREAPSDDGMSVLRERVEPSDEKNLVWSAGGDG